MHGTAWEMLPWSRALAWKLKTSFQPMKSILRGFQPRVVKGVHPVSHKMKSAVDMMNILGLSICMIGMLFPVQPVQASEAKAVVYGPAVPVPTLNLQSYSQWRAEKIQVSSAKIQEIQQKKRSETESSKSKELSSLKEAETREMENLNMAKKLRISDYLITYILSFPKRKAALKEAAALMTATEVAEIMEAYAQSLSKKEVGSVPMTADLIGSDSE